MPNIVATVQVEDLSNWEENFKTHGSCSVDKRYTGGTISP